MDMENQTEIAADTSPETTPVKEGLRRILIAEDDVSSQALWERVLQKMGSPYELDWATSGESAQRLFYLALRKNTPYDLVISDYYMTGFKTGFDLWRVCQTLKVPFLLVSAASLDKIDLWGADPKVDLHFMQKPLFIPECLKTVETLLDTQAHP